MPQSSSLTAKELYPARAPPFAKEICMSGTALVSRARMVKLA
jgi:hypothetical protein